MTGTDKILDAINDIQIHLSGHTVILTESIKPDIKEIKDHLVRQNNRIGKLEKDVVGVTSNCGTIQKEKEKSAQQSSNRNLRAIMIVGIVVTILLTVLGFWFNFSNTRQRTSINVLNDKVDSMVMRGAPAIKDISPLYE